MPGIQSASWSQAVPPFGNIFSIPIYADKSLEENEGANFNAGSNKKSIVMKYSDWKEVAEAKFVDIVK